VDLLENQFLLTRSTNC